MADIFLKKDVINLFKNKYVLMMGDSNMRCLYKDIIWLMMHENITPTKYFHAAMAKSPFCGDQIIEESKVINGRDYYQIREFKNSGCENLLLRYHFITRVYGKSVQMALDNIENGKTPMPQIVILNSCLWDLNRWGPSQEDTYKNNVVTLFQRLRSILPEDALVLWTTTLPVACETKGGFLIQQLQFMKHSLRFMIMEANLYVQQLCVAFEYDVLDLHYHMRHQLNSRTRDGIHWEAHAMRHITNLILTHIALSFEIPLNNLITNRYVMAAKHRALEAQQGVKVNIQLDKMILDKIFNEKGINKDNDEKQAPGIGEISKTPLRLITSNKENIVKASADTTVDPGKDKINVQSGNISPKVHVEGNKITSVTKIQNLSQKVDTNRNVTSISDLSQNSEKTKHFTNLITVSSTTDAASPIAIPHNSPTGQTSSVVSQTLPLVSISSIVTSTTESSSTVASMSEVQQTKLQEHLVVKRVIKQAKRRIEKTKEQAAIIVETNKKRKQNNIVANQTIEETNKKMKQDPNIAKKSIEEKIKTRKKDAIIAQKSIDENIKDCITNILHSPESTTCQLLLQTIDSIGKETSPSDKMGIIRESPRGGIAMATGSRGRGWGPNRGMQPCVRGVGRGRQCHMFESEFRGDFKAQTYDVIDWRDDVDWGDRTEWNDENCGYELGHVNYSGTNYIGFDNPSPRGNVFDRLGQIEPQPDRNHMNLGLQLRQEMQHDNFLTGSRLTASVQSGTNQQNNMPQDYFNSEFHRTATNIRRETNQNIYNNNHHELQQFNGYLPSNQQQHPSYSYDPPMENRQLFPPLQNRSGLQNRRDYNFGYMVPNDPRPFWDNYPTNNFPWNN